MKNILFKIMMMMQILLIILLLCFSTILLGSCATEKSLAKKLVPPASAQKVRLADIEKALYENDEPEKAIHLIGAYRAVYDASNGTANADIDSGEKIAAFWDDALEAMKRRQQIALDEKRFSEAASLARSLAACGIEVENTGEEADILLYQALEFLGSGDNLAAFLTAYRSNALEPLPPLNALSFLERAF